MPELVIDFKDILPLLTEIASRTDAQLIAIYDPATETTGYMTVGDFLSGVEGGGSGGGYTELSQFTQSAQYRLVTDTEKTSWSGQAAAALTTLRAGVVTAGDNLAKLYALIQAIEAGEGGTIPDQLSDLTDDATHRLVTDTEKSTWNAKVAPTLTITINGVAQTLAANRTWTIESGATAVANFAALPTTGVALGAMRKASDTGKFYLVSALSGSTPTWAEIFIAGESLVGLADLASEVTDQLGGGGRTRIMIETTGNVSVPAVADTDYAYIITGAHTMTMPTAVNGLANSYKFKNIHSANVTINTISAQTIDGEANWTLAPFDAIELISDGSNWLIF